MAELVKIAQARGENRANAIFFHGLGGDARTTWQPTYIKKGEASLWLEWLAQDIEGVSVYSVSYEAELSDWLGTVTELSDRAANVLNLLLLKPDLRSGELILAGHSFGGLVIKQLLQKAADEATDCLEAWHFIERIRKVAFFATPHVWADLASWSDWLHILSRPSAPARLLLHNHSYLRDLNLWYRTWAKQRGIDHLILTETRATSMFGGIIRPDNSAPDLATDPIPIDSDHIQIVKPINRKSETYQLVRKFIICQIGQPVLHEQKTIDAVRDDAQTVRENVDRLTAELSMDNAQWETLVGKLARVKAILGGTVGLVSGFLETMPERKIQREKFALTLSRIASHLKRARENIDALSPRLSALRQQAKAAHDAGRLDESENLIAEIARTESRTLKKLTEHARKILEEVKLCKRGAAETKAAQAALAHARLNYRDAAALYGEAASLVESFDPERRRALLFAHAGALYDQGGKLGDYDALWESIVLYRQLSALTPRQRAPLDWAMTQNNLGNALRLLGERESGTEKLEDAISAFREALKERTRERVPLDWAATQNNLGIALETLGERESATEKLEEAVKAYCEALTEWTRERAPLDWAATQNNLGTALGELGVREGGTEKLEEAVLAFRAALTEYTREQVPGDWAGTQMNLGRVLLTLGKREGGTGKLEEAVSAYREALKEWTPEATPYWHDITQKNLDEANALLAERHGTASALIACQEFWLQKSDHKKPILQRVQFRHGGPAIGAPPPPDSDCTKNPADLI